MAQALGIQVTTPKVFVYTYEKAGFINAPNGVSEHEDVAEYTVRDRDAVAVPTVALFYMMLFNESEGHISREVKIVVVDDDEERARRLIEAVRAAREIVDEMSANEIIDIITDIYQPDEYSNERMIHEMDGYSYVKTIYMLQL